MPRILMERSGEMEVFVRVVQAGGFSAAARSLDLTPSAVSKLIARLEARLGSRLLLRTTRALTLTEEGETYYQAGTRILQDIDEADQAATAGSVRGRLRINASLPFGAACVAPAVPSFLAHHPDVTVDLSFTDDVVDLVAQKADIAFRVGGLPDSALMARKLSQSRYVICASPDYLARQGTPQVPDDLLQHNCLGFNFRKVRSPWPFVVDGRDIALPVAGNLLVNNGETLRQMALAGAGIARMGLWHAAADIAAGRLVPVLDAFRTNDLELIHAVYVGGGHVPNRVRAFIDHMTDWLAAHPVPG
jgi:DNA-binding transcriptional LysR family regulator